MTPEGDRIRTLIDAARVTLRWEDFFRAETGWRQTSTYSLLRIGDSVRLIETNLLGDRWAAGWLVRP